MCGRAASSKQQAAAAAASRMRFILSQFFPYLFFFACTVVRGLHSWNWRQQEKQRVGKSVS